MHKNNLEWSARIVSLSVAVSLMTGFGLAIPTIAFADSEASALQFVVVSDDIRKDTTAVARGAGSSDADGSQTNNGHGNNADGVDSSNPGQGGGGPNGAIDESGSVDDEAGGGGAAPSKSNNGNGSNK